MIEKWDPDDVIALVLCVGLIILLMMGHDHMLTNVFVAVNAAYLGIKQVRKTKE